MKHWIDDIHQLWHFPIDLRYPEFVQYCWLNCKNLLLRAPVWKCGEKQTLRYWTLSLHCGFLFGPRREWFKWCREVVQLMKLYGAGTAPTAGWKRSVAHPVSSHSSWHYTVTRLFVSHFTGKKSISDLLSIPHLYDKRLPSILTVSHLVRMGGRGLS